MSKEQLHKLLVCVVIPLAFILPFIGNVHLFEWDEINFAECAREMVISNRWDIVQINFEPFWEKPPLFFWLQAICMKIFGIGEFAARLPNTIVSVLYAFTMYAYGKRNYNHNFALTWILVFFCSALPFLYFKSGIIDPWFNYFIVTALFSYHSYISCGKQLKHLILSAFLIGLAVLTKGPVALLLYGLSVIVFGLLHGKQQLPKWQHTVIAIVTVTSTLCLWLIPMIIASGIEQVQKFFAYQWRLLITEDAGHGGPWFYHLVVLFFGVLPASVIVVLGCRYKYKIFKQQDYLFQLMTILGLLGLLLFSIVKTKIVHYSSICYIPLSFIAAHFIYNKRIVYKKSIKIVIALVLLTLATAIFLIPLGLNRLDYFAQQTNDLYTEAALQAGINLPTLYWVPAAISIVLSALIILSPLKSHTLVISSVGFLCLWYSIILIYIKPIEEFSQRAEINFYKQIAEQNGVIASHFKNYGQYFYGNCQVNKKVQHWQANHNPAYMVSRINATNEIEQTGLWQQLSSERGFTLWRRKQTE